VTLDRGEAQGTALALLLHVALVVALTMNIASPPKTPEPPAVEVELVESEDVALTAAAPQQASPPPPSQAPAPAEPTPALPEPPQPAPSLPPPEPIVRPTPAPVVRQAPLPRPAPAARSVPTRPSPPQARPAPARPALPRQSRLGDDFLASVPNAPPSPARSAQQGAAIFSAAAKASVNDAILRQIRPCADRQPALGPGADRLRVVINLRIDRSGRVSRTERIDVRGVDDENRAFEDLAYNQAVAVFRSCSPLRLPAELYSTPQGGWGNITMTYRPK
jgi:outer membrane biosynthesis protein TonB